MENRQEYRIMRKPSRPSMDRALKHNNERRSKKHRACLQVRLILPESTGKTEKLGKSEKIWMFITRIHDDGGKDDLIVVDGKNSKGRFNFVATRTKIYNGYGLLTAWV